MARIRLFVVVLSVGVFVAAPSLASAQPSLGTARAPAAHQARSSEEQHFIDYAGLAFGAFQHYIYTPYKDRKFKTSVTEGRPFPRTAKVRSEAADPADYALNASKLALREATSAKLSVGPLDAVVRALAQLPPELMKGAPVPLSSTIRSLESSITSVEDVAKKADVTITATLPSSEELARKTPA